LSRIFQSAHKIADDEREDPCFGSELFVLRCGPRCFPSRILSELISVKLEARTQERVGIRVDLSTAIADA
jgi:hypothetical protein